MTTTMRAVTIDRPGGPDALTLTRIPRPERTGSEVLVRVVAAGANPVDAKTRAGAGAFAAITRFPAVLGNDFSGEVVEAPYEAHDLQPGTAVYGMGMVPRMSGSYAEYLAVSDLSVIRKPAALSHVEAAAVPLAALTAWGMVVSTATAHEGQRMLIHAGAGGVGHFAVQFATHLGAHVVATASGANVGWLRDLGAAEAIDYSTERFEDRVSEVDVVIDLVGNTRDRTSSRSLGVVRRGGLIVSAPSGGWPTMREEAAAAGVRATGYRVTPDGATLAIVSRLLDSGDVRVHVDGVHPLADAGRVHELLEAGHVRGKLVLSVADR